MKYQLVTDVERFNDIVKNWRDDGIFAEQRLSGNNPMVLRRVTENSSKCSQEKKKTQRVRDGNKASILES